jgi:hypothetical protein
MSKTDDSEAKEDQVKAEESAKAEAKPATKPVAREDDDEDEDDEDDEEEDRAAAPPKREPARHSAKAQSSRREQKSSPPKASSLVPMPRVALFVIVALAAGGAGGWFGQEAQAKARVKAESVAAPAGSGVPAGPCGAWQSKVCNSAGDTSAVCTQAKGAAELLAPSTCESALSMMPATLAKVKEARKSCDTLVSKLCKDLPPNSSSCGMVKEKTPAFPSQRCDEMLKHYDEVLASLRQLEEQGGMPGGPGGPGMQRPPGAVPGH